MKPVCVPCKRFFRVKKSGFYFLEGMPKTSGARPGVEEPENWQPYKLWAGDRYECQGCGAVILSGFGHSPIAERHHDDFEEMVKCTGADRLQVNDC